MLIKKIKKMAILLLLSLFILSACAREEENVINAAENVEAYTSSIINDFNSIKNNESELQQQFVDSLASDDDLSTFQDKTATVFQNIENRQNSLSNIKNQTKELENTYHSIEELNFDALDEESVAAMHEDMKATIDSLQTYTTDYQDFLNQQNEYFTHLASDEANYESFTQGIEDMADQDQALITIEHQLNQNLYDLETTSKNALNVAREQFENGI